MIGSHFVRGAGARDLGAGKGGRLRGGGGAGGVGPLPDAEADHRGFRGDDVSQAALENDRSSVHDPDSIAEALGFLKVVGREDHRDALRFEVLEESPYAAARFGVEPGRGLVEEEDRGLPHESAREVEAALFTAGERADLDFRAVREVDGVEGLLRGHWPRARSCPHANRFSDGQLGGEAAGLEHGPRVGANLRAVLRGVHAEDRYAPACGGCETFDDFES